LGTQRIKHAAQRTIVDMRVHPHQRATWQHDLDQSPAA